MDVVKITMKKCNLSKDLTKDKSKWRNRISIADPNILGQGFDNDDELGSFVFIKSIECRVAKFDPIR